MKRSIIVLIILCFGLALIMGVIHSCKKSTSPSTESYYIGNMNTKVFHRPSCSYLPSAENQIRFNTRQDAINAGYKPCEHCKP